MSSFGTAAEWGQGYRQRLEQGGLNWRDRRVIVGEKLWLLVVDDQHEVFFAGLLDAM
jgi:hypothetical protein